MATNDIPLKVSDNTERVSLRVSDGRSVRSITPDSGSPYYVGARAYVTQTENGAVVTVIDKDGTTTATILNGQDGVVGKDGKDGVDGQDGADGVGITSITQNLDGTLTINLDDGSHYDTEPLKGADGADGQDGYTPIKGVDYFDGVDGADGKDGKDGTDGQDGYTPIKGVDYFDGEDGADGKDGTDGQDGQDGADGVGIASITKTATVGLVDTYTITYTDGSTSTYQVTNGANGSGSVADVWVDGASVLDGDTAKIDLTGKSDVGHTHTKSDITDFPTLAAVATSGDYDDLTNKPTLPTKTMWVGSCSSNSASRVVTTTTGDFVLAAGNSVRIAFEYASQGGVYLNIDGTGSKSLYNASYKWQANEIVDVIYDGTTYVLVDSATASTVYYGVTKLSDSIDSTRQDIAATSYAVKTAYDLANSKSDFSGDYNDLTNKPTIPTVPSNVSAFTNDAGYLTSYTETDPTVPAWAKAVNKPTYTAFEVGALPSTTPIPSKTSDLTNDSGFITGYTETDPIFSASAAHGITSTDISNWNGKSDFSGDYDDLTNKPTIQTIYASTVAPTSADGEDGDVWFVY